MGVSVGANAGVSERVNRDLSRLLHPRSLALIGGKEASEALRQCRRLGFAGEIWRVHPSKKEDQGVPCFADVKSLPAAPDAGWVGVNREASIPVVEALAQRGAGAAICYASGFHETGDDKGADYGARLLHAAGDMPLVGPNCYGLINYLDGALCWPDQQGGTRCERGVALLCQSSNIAMNMTMQRRGVPFAYIAALGNQLQLDFCDLALALLQDERVSAIGLHIEGIRDAANVTRLAQAAQEKRIPVVALAVGKSEQAVQAKLSHTASLSGSHAIAEAFFARLGIPLLPSLPALLEALKLLHVHGALPGRDICSLSCSGGEAALLADAAQARNLSLRPLSKQGEEKVRATTHPLVRVANPLDYHTFDWGREAPLRATFTAMLEQDFDLSMLIMDFPHPQSCVDANWLPAVRALCAATQTTGANAAVLATLHENMLEQHARWLLEQGIAPLCGIDDALLAADAAASIGEAWQKPFLAPAAPREADDGEEMRLLDEWEAKRMLREFAIPVVEGEKAHSVAEARTAAQRLGYPLAVKALGLAHKSEHNALRLGIHDEAQLMRAVEELLPLGDGVLVERMAEDVVAELIIGVLADPLYGMVMSIGAGGIWTEMLADARLLPLPVRREDIADALGRLRILPLLEGRRGGARADMEAIVDAAMAVQDCALARRDIRELDVNPLLVRAPGRGAVAADALIRMRLEKHAGMG